MKNAIIDISENVQHVKKDDLEFTRAIFTVYYQSGRRVVYYNGLPKSARAVLIARRPRRIVLCDNYDYYGKLFRFRLD